MKTGRPLWVFGALLCGIASASSCKSGGAGFGDPCELSSDCPEDLRCRSGSCRLNESTSEQSSSVAEGTRRSRIEDLSREEILEVVNNNIDRVNLCYEKRLQKNPELQGKVIMDWIVSPSGAVESVEPRSWALTGQVEPDCVEKTTKCIGDAIRTWSFPKPRSGRSVKVTFPFVFRPAKV